MVRFKKQTYNELVCEYIREALLEGELAPGDAVNEMVLAKKLAISRAPIREAMQALSREGLITIKPQKGKYISSLTSRQIKDSYFTGGVLEAAAVADALPFYKREDIQKLTQVVQEMKKVFKTAAPIEQMASLDNEFHNILFHRISNKLLVELCRRSCQGISKFLLFKHWLKLFSAKEIYIRHKKILDVIKKGQKVDVEKCIRQHYIEAGEQMCRFGSDVYGSQQDF